MRRDAALRKVDRVLVWKVTRFGRDMRDVISTGTFVTLASDSLIAGLGACCDGTPCRRAPRSASWSLGGKRLSIAPRHQLDRALTWELLLDDHALAHLHIRPLWTKASGSVPDLHVGPLEVERVTLQQSKRPTP